MYFDTDPYRRTVVTTSPPRLPRKSNPSIALALRTNTFHIYRHLYSGLIFFVFTVAMRNVCATNADVKTFDYALRVYSFDRIGSPPLRERIRGILATNRAIL